MVSASLEAYVAPGGSLLGADGAVATRLEVVGGRLTGRYDGANSRGEEKLRRLGEWVATPATRLNGPGPTATAEVTCACSRRPTSGSTSVVSAASGRLRAFPSLAQVVAQQPTDHSPG